VRTEGTTYAVVSLTCKVGCGVGAAVAGYAIGLGGYVASSNTQSHSAITAIKIAAGAVPAAGVLAALAVMSFYPLTESVFCRTVAQIAGRRATATLGLRADQSPNGAPPPGAAQTT
jgi:glucuronide carrier protein